MSFDYYFNKDKTKIEEIKKPNSKMMYHKSLINKMKKLFEHKLIETLDYTFMLEFIKNKGGIVYTQRYHKIRKNIIDNPKIGQQDKDEFNEYTTQLFSHIHNLFDNDEMKIDFLINDLHNDKDFKFTNDQKTAIKNVCEFLYNNETKTFGLYGFAGTGKTTTITKLIHYLLTKNYISSIVFTAPTNKAVNVIKSKFRNDLDNLIQTKFNTKIVSDESLDDILDKLEEKGYRINFLTIHKLLNYQNDFDVEGERVFIKGDKASLDNYDLVIVDESSMIPFQIIMHLFEEANKNNILSKKTPKILFLGDPAQLPPVNEDISVIFAKNNNDFNFDLYKKMVVNNSHKTITDIEGDICKFMENKFTIVRKQILDMKYVTMKQVMRSNDDKVIKLCNEVRAFVLNEIKIPKLAKFNVNCANRKVYLYQNNKDIPKTSSPWFKKALEYFSSKDTKQHLSNIILTWTNKQTDDYNETMRKILNGKEKLNKFEVGDILILTDFYNIKETQVEDKKNKNDAKRFYTSEQIKVTDIEHVTKAITEFTESAPGGLSRVKNSNDIKEKYVRTVKLINKGTTRKYNTWKLYVHKLADVLTDKMPETHQIYVVNDDSNDILVNDRKFVAEKIKELRNYYRNMHKESLMQIDNHIIKPLWKELNKKLVDPFAKISYGAVITTHKSQGSNFYNVFVDVDDILKNNRIEEAKRCFYTAITRTSNALHLLI